MSKKSKTIIIVSIVAALLVLAAAVAALFFIILPRLAPGKAPANSSNYYSEPLPENIAVDSDTGLDYADNEVLISAVEGSSYKDIEKLAASRGGAIVGYIEAFDEYQIRFDKAYSNAELYDLMQELEEDKNVEAATFNYGMRLSENSLCVEPNDPWDKDQSKKQDWDVEKPDGNNWGVEAIYAPLAWDYRDEMHPINIGLIDGGFEPHEDLTFEWTRAYEADSHGNHVAGIMAADFDNGKGVTGVMPTRKSNGDKLVNLLGIAYNSSGLYWVMEYKSAFAELLLRNTKVINVSQGHNWYKAKEDGWENGFDSSYWTNHNITDMVRNLVSQEADLLEPFLIRCLEKGYDFVIVSAAGNDNGIDATYSSPLNAIDNERVKAHIIVVGGICNLGVDSGLFGSGNHNGYGFYADLKTKEKGSKQGTNLGSRVDVMAPAVDIYSCVLNNGYGKMTGTSMATPHASGVAAMVWSLDPSLSGEEVKRIVVETADRPLEKDGITYNILNAARAVRRVTGDSDTPKPSKATEPQNGSFIGKVCDAETEEFLADVLIKTYDSSGNEVDTAFTDDYGQFELILRGGEYTLTASLEGYKDSTQENVRVENGNVNYLPWFYLEKKEKPTSPPASPPEQSGAGADFLIGEWSTSDGVGLTFYDDGSYIMDWGFLPEEGSWSAEPLTESTLKISMDGNGILTLMSLVYGGAMSDYHFEILKCNNDNFYLVQVYGDYTARTSPCKLGFTRDGAARDLNY